MLYFLLSPLGEHYIIFNPFSYITVRTALAGLSALILSLFLGKWFIGLMKKYQVGEQIRPHGPKSHVNKQGTPSMGGIMIIGATLIPTFLWADLNNTYIWLAVATMLLFGGLGLRDDYLKIIKKKPSGMTIRNKLFIQVLLAAAIGGLLIILGTQGEFNLRLSLPFIKKWMPYLGLFYLPWIMFILVGSSNSVNMADGLDGLAIGLTVISAGAFTALSYIAGNAVWSEYLDILWVPRAAELTIFAGAMAGACLGFLWFNSHPAQIFMGDVGSLALGASIGLIAILIKQEFLLFMVAGVFILEALSVLMQIIYFRTTGGKRIFKMAPLHHHFEMIGWSEEKIVVRFWITAIIFALFSLTTLKLR